MDYRYYMVYEKYYNEECETDLDFYNYLASEGYGECQIKEIMNLISGADDAYYHALEQAEELE